MNKIYNPQPGWYRGDFHAHTTVSPDGLHSPAEFVALARDQGLDFVAITDHNKIGAWEQLSHPPEILVLPGLEVTLHEGHWNVFPIAGPLAWMTELQERYDEAGGVSQNTPFVAQTLKTIAAAGQLNSINHPHLPPWAWQLGEIDLRDVQCVELINDPTWPGGKGHPSNLQATGAAVALWTRWLNAGHRITAIGGSDYHGPKTTPPGYRPRLTHPATYVYAPELSVTGILQGVRQRRAYITMAGTVSFKANLNGQTFDIGQDIGASQGDLTLTGQLTAFPPGYTARIIKNG
jgi:hypothetical protein